ncbi:MAG: AI-2E family transporter [Clostridia bacterium]|nr:AI-2E family transporter [Clostridia bacterium]
MKNEMRIKIEWKTCLRVGISAFLLFLCIHYWTSTASVIKTFIGAVLPLIIGAVIAYPLSILMNFYGRHIFKNAKNKNLLRCKNGICLALTLLTLVAIITFVIAMVVPQLVNCVKLLIDKVPGAIKIVTDYVSQFEFIPDDIFEMIYAIDWKSKIGEIISTVTTGLGSAANVVISTVSSVVSGVTSAVLSVIFAVYLLLSKEKLTGQVNRVARHYVKKSLYDKARYILSVADDAFKKFIVGQCTEALILGGLCTVGMLILRLPYAVMMGAVTAFTALIPVVGALIGGAIGAVLIFVESPVKALIFIIFIVVLQQLEGDLIYPKVVGTSIGLPGVWVFTAVTIGAGVFGILGMLISVPIAATAYRLLRNELSGEGLSSVGKSVYKEVFEPHKTE